jgi:hypothetical protein
MSLDWQVVRHHGLVIVAVSAGIAGMGVAFTGAMDANWREVSRGIPLLLIGLWWAGRELGRSMQASRTQQITGSSHGASSQFRSRSPANERARGDT